MSASSSTSGIVVEDAVVGAGVGVRLPEGRRAAAQRRQVQLLVGHSVPHLGSQSVNVPVHKSLAIRRR